MVSNSKNIKDHFLSQDKSYDWGRLAFMLDTSAGPKNIFRQVKRNHIADIHYQYHGYFGLLGIKKIGYDALPDRLIVSNLQNVNGNIQQVQYFYDRVRSYMISKETELSNKTTFHKKLRLHRREYKSADTGGIIWNYGPTMLYLILKTTIPDIKVGVSNQKDEIMK